MWARSRQLTALLLVLMMTTLLRVHAATLQAASTQKSTHSTFDVRKFGAKGNGTHDDSQAIQTALDLAAQSGGLVYFQRGSYLVSRPLYVYGDGVHIAGDGATTQILAADGIADDGVLVVGFKAKQQSVPSSNILIENLTVDARFNTFPIMFDSVNRGRVSGVTALHSTNWVLRMDASTDITVENCFIEGGRGAYGDGLIFQGCVRPAARNNVINDVTRIGIVTEKVNNTNSEDALIEGNSVSYAHDNQGGELNGGIWIENTNGARVLGNRLRNLTNHSGQSRGITLAWGDASPAYFELVGNDVSDAKTGIYVNVGLYGSVSISGLVVHKTLLNSFDQGVLIGSARAVAISGLVLDKNTYDGYSSGSIVFDLCDPQSGCSDVSAFSLSNSISLPSNFIGGAADLNFVDDGSNLHVKVCTATGVKDWLIAGPPTGCSILP